MKRSPSDSVTAVAKRLVPTSLASVARVRRSASLYKILRRPSLNRSSHSRLSSIQYVLGADQTLERLDLN